MEEKNLDLKKEYEESINLFEKLNRKFFEVELPEGDSFEKSKRFIFNKLKLGEGLKWKDEDLLGFVKSMSRYDVPFFYIFSPEVREEDTDESEESESQNILKKHLGQVAFIVISCVLGGITHYCEKTTGWYKESKENYQQSSEFNDDQDDEYEEIEGVEERFICPKCGEILSLEIDDDDDLDEGVETDCPYCEEEITLYTVDLEENGGRKTTRFICPECGKSLYLEIDGDDDLDERVETDCPHCKEEIILDREDLAENGDEEITYFRCPKCGERISLEINDEDNLYKGVETDCPYCKQEITLYKKDLEKDEEEEQEK